MAYYMKLELYLVALYCYLTFTPSVYPSLIQIIQNDNCIGGAASFNCTLTGPISVSLTGVNININDIGFTLIQVQSSFTFNGINMSHFHATATNMGLDSQFINYTHIEVIINITTIIAEYRNIAIGCRLASDPSNSANTQFPLPSPPTTAPSINATALGAVCGVMLNWTAPYSESPITGYILYQNGAMMSNATATSYNIAQLISGETYNYTVLATTCVGTSPVSQDELFTAPKDAGISATSCTATYDAMNRVFTLVFTQPLQNYPISYIINISSANSTQLFTTSSTVLTTPVYTTVLMLDTVYNYTDSIKAVLNCPSASNVTCSTNVTIIPITSTTTTTTATTPTTTTTTYSASSVTNTDISSTSDSSITNSIDTTITNSILSSSSTTSMQTDTVSSTSSPPGSAFSASVIIASSVTIFFVVLVLIILVIIVVIVIIVLNKRAKAKSAQSGANTNNYTNNNTINNKQLTYADLDLVNISSDVKQQIPRSNYAAIDQTKLD